MKSNMKKITALLLTAVLCLCFTSCVNNTSVTINNNYESNTEQNTTSAVSTESEEETTEASSETEESTAKKETTTSTKTTNKQSKTEKTTAQSTTKNNTTSKAEITCTLTVECKAILSNIDDLKPGHEKYVPSNGYILNNYICNIKSGDTVFDVLEKACDNNSIVLNSRSSGYGVYVAGINNLDEFDCGSQSGWKYKVNGVDANRSSNYYKLSGGENIVFYYTVTA